MVYIKTISAVSGNVKFMRTRLNNWDEGKVHRVFPQFFDEQDINIVFILQKNHINPSTFIF